MSLADLLPLTRPLVGFDLETTGVSDTSRIVEFACEVFVPGKPVKEYRTLIQPEEPIPAGATAVHGITDEMVLGAPRFEDLADNLLKGFQEADFVGYNVRFDMRILGGEFRRCGRVWEYETARVIDPFRLWQILEPRSLDDAATRWLAPEELAALEEGDAAGRGQLSHTALYDIKRTTRILAAMLRARPDVLPANLQQLHELCSPNWYDADGRLQWREGYLTFSFGKNRGHSLQWVARHDPTYFRFILRKDFSDKVKAACREAMDGRFPVAPATATTEENDETS